MKPTDLQPKVHPLHTRDGRPIRDGRDVMPGPDDSFIAYGRNWATVSNTPLREYKHFVHEGGISTPLIAHWPGGNLRKGAIENQPGHLIDLMATCVDVSKSSYPTKTAAGHDILPMQGVSLLPGFAGEPLQRKSPIFFEHEGNRAVRDGQWKLVAKGITGEWELYDIEADRTETNNLAAIETDRARQLADKWTTWAEASNVLPMRPWDQSKRKRDQ